MPTVQSLVGAAQTAVTGVALLLAGVALLMWANHLLLVGTAASMGQALVWTVVSVTVLLTLTAMERVVGA